MVDGRFILLSCVAWKNTVFFRNVLFKLENNKKCNKAVSAPINIQYVSFPVINYYFI